MMTDEKYSPLRQTLRIRNRKKCILRQAHLNTEGVEAYFVETLDYSYGGLGIIFDGDKLSVGNRYYVYIEPLNIIRKAARIVWIKSCNGDYKAGLQWL